MLDAKSFGRLVVDSRTAAYLKMTLHFHAAAYAFYLLLRPLYRLRCSSVSRHLRIIGFAIEPVSTGRATIADFAGGIFTPRRPIVTYTGGRAK